MQLDHSKDTSAHVSTCNRYDQCINTSCVEVVLIRRVSTSHHKNER